MKELTIFHATGPEGEPGKIRVRYRADADGAVREAEADFDFSVDRDDHKLRRWYLSEFLSGPWGDSGPRAERAERTLDRVGERLFRAVFGHAETRALYEMAVEDLSETRIIIHAPDPTGTALPWELLCDPDREEIGGLACSAHSFTRSHPTAPSSPTAQSAPSPGEREDAGGTSLNILVLISHAGCTGRDPAIRSITRSLLELVRPHKTNIRVHVLWPPSLQQLSRVLEERPGFYHVLHMEVPGMTTEGALAGPHQTATRASECLVLEGEDGDLRPVTGQELGGVVARAAVPFVVLIPPATAADDHGSVLPSIAQQVQRAGVRGVLTMAEPVLFQTAFTFLARLYEKILGGMEICRAVTRSREDLRMNQLRASPIGDIALHDWSVPILYQASSFHILTRFREDLRLNPDAVNDQQPKADGEIDCPDPPAYGLVGRDEEILKLDRALRTSTVVVLTGAAGIGKTEAAAALVRWLAETGSFQGPTLCFHFDHRLPLVRICNRVGEALPPAVWVEGEGERSSSSELDRRSAAVRALNRSACLVIWDGFESVAGHPPGTPSRWTAAERDELRQFLYALKGGRTRVLITSRSDEGWLGDIGQPVELPGLKLVEAQRLVVRILKRAGVSAQKLGELADYNGLLRFLEGNPLAIQIMAPELLRVAGEELVETLHSHEERAAALFSRIGCERPLAVSLSYRLDALDAELRGRLALLGLFQGFVDCDVLAALGRGENAPQSVRGLGRGEWIAILESVAGAGLLRRLGGGCFSIHPAVPEFFRILLGASYAETAAGLETDFAAVYGAVGLAFKQDLERTKPHAPSLAGYEENNLLHAGDLARRHRLAASLEAIDHGLRVLYANQGRLVEGERLVKGSEREGIESREGVEERGI